MKAHITHQAKKRNTVGQIIIPTSQKVLFAAILTIVTILLSFISVGIYMTVKDNPVTYNITNALMFIINFGGGIGNSIYSNLKENGIIEAGNTPLFYAIPIVFQFIYYYLIVAFILAASKVKGK